MKKDFLHLVLQHISSQKTNLDLMHAGDAINPAIVTLAYPSFIFADNLIVLFTLNLSHQLG
jgi:hypothetical protein